MITSQNVDKHNYFSLLREFYLFLNIVNKKAYHAKFHADFIRNLYELKFLCLKSMYRYIQYVWLSVYAVIFFNKSYKKIFRIKVILFKKSRCLRIIYNV